MNDVTVRITGTLTPALRMFIGNGLFRLVCLESGSRLVIGRDESADLRIADTTINKRHCRVECDEQARVVVVDLGSTNGTSVNGIPVSSARLRAGDTVHVGAVVLKLELLTREEVDALQQALPVEGSDP